jgi:hypothetical protein
VFCPACRMGRVRKRAEFLDMVAQWLTALRR